MQISGLGLIQNSGRNERSLQKILQQLSTAKRINSAADDAAGLAISQQLETQSRGFSMASQNVNDAMSALNIGEGAGNEISSMLQRQRDLALQSSNATLNDTDRKNIDTEYQALSQEIDRTANATQFNTQGTAAGTGLASGNAVIQTGANQGDTVKLPSVNMTAAGLGIAGTSVATAGSAQAAIGRIDTALNTLNTQRSTVGSMVNRFESTLNNLNVSEANTQAAQSVLSDQDMALGMANLVRNQLLQQTSTLALSRFNEMNANNTLALLQ
ncbi:MAG: flagellin [Chitinivibrionales bacterium]|nr:flagellin [Chitinivibrionales bacterium]